MNGLIFQMYVRDCLAPELRPGDTVIMDNLGSHKSVRGYNSSVKLIGGLLLISESSFLTP